MIFTNQVGEDSIEVRYQDETIWLTQKLMAELFSVDRSVITKHLQNIFNDNELDQDSVCARFAHTAADGKNYNTSSTTTKNWCLICEHLRISADNEKDKAKSKQSSKNLMIRSSTAEVLIFTRQSGEGGIEVRYEDKTIWLTQKLMAELFEVTVPTINEHLKTIFASEELTKNATIRNFRIAAAD